MNSWLSSLSESSSKCCLLFDEVLYDHSFCSEMAGVEVMCAIMERLMPQKVAVLREAPALWTVPAELPSAFCKAERVSGDSRLKFMNGRGVKARLPDV